MNQQARKAIGCGGLLVYLGAYAAGAATLGTLIAPALPAWGGLAYYAVAGVIWILPLKPLFGWMNRRDPS
jgi:hypothetical protein